MKHEFNKNGFFIVNNVINEKEVQSLINTLKIFNKEINHYGIRNLMDKCPPIREFALSIPLLSIARQILGHRAQPIRAVFFDKHPDANWNVAWHQDTSITVKEKINIPGFNAWREKNGVMHVEPPETYLANILSLRVHLDPANTESGVLRVIAKSHKDGRVNSNNILTTVAKSKALECTANVGDVLLMNPLLFHSSRKATRPKHRRVIHLEYSAMSLPPPMKWYEGAC